MRELDAIRSLSDILADLEQHKLESRAQEEKDNSLREAIVQLNEKTRKLLAQSGESEQTEIGVGAGEGIIGFRYEPAYYRITPPVYVEINGQKEAIQVVENLEAGNNYSHDVGSYSVNLLQGDVEGNNKKELLRIYRDRVINWRQEPATVEQIKIADTLIDHMLDSLPEVEVNRGWRPQVRGRKPGVLPDIKELMPRSH